MANRKWIAAAALLALVLAAGCGTEPEREVPPPPVAGLQPVNDTPEHAVLRLVAAFEQKKYAEYAGMFTGDYQYLFADIDPALQQKWLTGWFRADEDSFAAHLFHGGQNVAGEMLVPADSIDMTLGSALPAPDTTQGRDPARYQMLATLVDGKITIPNPGSPDPTIYVLSGLFQRLWLVRGDAAAGLEPGQPADSTRWYVWKWEDVTTQLGYGVASARATWGRIRGIYR